MYYGGSSDHSVLGRLARLPVNGLREPLASAHMAADVDARGHPRRRRRIVVRTGSGRGALRRTAALSRPSGVYPGSRSRYRPVPRVEATLPAETSLCTRAPLLGGIAPARSILVSFRSHHHSL